MTQEEVEKLPSYRLLKDLPFVKAGRTFRPYRFRGDQNQVEYTPPGRWTPAFNESTISMNPDWFEKIPTRWQPKTHETYFSISLGHMSVSEYEWIDGFFDTCRLGMNNVFKTREDASKARDRIVSLLAEIQKEAERK